MAYHALQISAVHVTGAGNTAVNVYHFAPDGAWPVGSPVTLANSIIAKLGTFYSELIAAGCIVPDWTIGASVVELDEGSPSSFVAATPYTTTATMSGTYVPNQLAVVISWRTGTPGKSYRGRTFLGPITSNMVSGTGMNNVGRGNAQGAADDLLAALDGSGEQLVIVSKVASASTPVVNAFVDSKIDTLRSRAS